MLCLASIQNVLAQAPNITYNPSVIKVTGTIPFTISPKNTGGTVPAVVYGQVTTFAGSPTGMPGFVDGVGTAALFNNSQDMAKDAAGNLYVADANNNAIRKITPAGVVSTFAGSHTGEVGFADGQDTSARFDYPDGLAFDALGNLFVSDYYNFAIRKITPGGMVTTFYQNTAELFDPQALTFDSAGNLIFALQYGHQVVKLSPSAVLTTIAGVNQVPGSNDGIGIAAHFDAPTDARLDAAGNLIIADSQNNEIRKIAPDGTVTTFAGSANSPVLYENGPALAARFNYLTGVEIGPGGVIYIVDLLNNDIRIMMPDGTVSLLAGSPSQTPGNTDGILTAAKFSQPCYMRIDKTGTGYIAEWGLGGASRIRKIALAGYSLKGTLPQGLTFDSTTGTISGTVSNTFTTKTDTVTAFNTSGFSTTIITFTYQQFSSVSTLINLVPSVGSLDPAFVSTTNNYVDSVSNAAKTITLTPTATDINSTITVNGKPVVSGTPSDQIPLAVGPNIITTVVTAQDGVTTKTYTVNVIRAPDSNANLIGLAVSKGTLSPVFNSGIVAYMDTVSNATTSITATPTDSDSTATITVNGKPVVSGTPSDQIPLAIGPNIITTVITAQDSVTKNTYTVNVIRAPSPDANLIGLTVSKGTLSPVFNSGIKAYTDTVYNATTSITATPTDSDSTATITVNGKPVVSGTPSDQIPLAIGPNIITTVVTAQDGITTKTYTVNVIRAPGSNANLIGLAVSKGTLSPAFNSGIMAYTDTVSNATTSITATPTDSDSTATITVNGKPVVSGTPSDQIPLAVGPNIITTVVTAQDGITTKTYTVNVIRAPDSNANLIGLAVSQGTLSPAFSSGIMAYADTVTNATTSITATPTDSDITAAITVNEMTTASGTASNAIPLAVGSNTITVVITAQDGVTTHTYTVTVYRGEAEADIVSNNVLTPNGDGKNDYWVIKDIALYPQNNVTVFDKGGRVVYYKQGYNSDWDGTLNGRPLAEGTYYYVIDLGFKQRKFKGFISIVRN